MYGFFVIFFFTLAIYENKVIQGAIDEYTNRTCIRWVPYVSGDENWVEISPKNKHCYSEVGKMGGGQIINLERPGPWGGGCVIHGTVVHEMMHTIGFYHQQSATDRDDYINVYLDNVSEKEKNNFDKYGDNIITSFGYDYDYKSVLHYSERAFSKNGEKTTEAKVVVLGHFFV